MNRKTLFLHSVRRRRIELCQFMDLSHALSALLSNQVYHFLRPTEHGSKRFKQGQILPCKALSLFPRPLPSYVAPVNLRFSTQISRCLVGKGTKSRAQSGFNSDGDNSAEKGAFRQNENGDNGKGREGGRRRRPFGIEMQFPRGDSRPPRKTGGLYQSSWERVQCSIARDPKARPGLVSRFARRRRGEFSARKVCPRNFARLIIQGCALSSLRHWAHLC